MFNISRSEKEKFVADLNEDDFREKVVRRLFRALGFRDGRDTCGPEEYGKDAIFVEVDKFGVENFTAIQTKKGNINLSGDPAANLHSLIAQIRTALNQPHVCTKSKRKALPTTVYAIASGRINQAARTYIADQVSDPRVRFLDRDDLITQVDDHCPEIWGDIVADVSPYLKSLANRVEELSLVTDENPIHSSLGAFAAASDHRFVDVKLGYHSPKIVRRSGKPVEEMDYEEISGSALLSGKPVRALLLGDAGSGKTTLLIRLAYLLARNGVSSKSSYRVPIFTRSHELLQIGSRSFFEFFEDLVRRIQDLSATPFTLDDFEAGRVVLLVDGLDELAEASDRQRVIDLLSSFSQQYPACSVALASRPYSSVNKLSGLEKFKRYRISPLSMDDASKMLTCIGGKNKSEEVAEWRKEILRRLNGIHGIELNPLLVTVFAVSAGGADKKDIPANITELFSKFAELMLGRWDEKKGLAQQYQAKVKDHLLSSYAFKLQAAGDSRFMKSDFVEYARTRLEEMNLSADLDTIVSEIVIRSGLLRGDDELEFKHHLLQEFFAARGVPNLEYIKGVINDEWWRNSIVFYFGSRPDAVNDLLEVATDQCSRADDSYLTVGLALQACYLSKLDDRIEVWKWVAEGAASASLRELENPHTDYPLTAFLTGYLEGRDAVALGGIEKSSTGVEDWVTKGNHFSATPELRRFWYAVALGELAEYERLEKFIKGSPIDDEKLLMAIHFGCYFASEVRSMPDASKRKAAEICRLLEPRIAHLRYKITEEFKGQLLEYRNKGVVALDAVDPAEEPI